MHFALSLFILGYVCSKLLAVALLGSVSGITLVVILLSECAVLLLARAAMKNWRYFSAAGDSTASRSGDVVGRKAVRGPAATVPPGLMALRRLYELTN